MKTILLKIGSKRYKRRLPESYAQMTRKQVIAVARVYQHLQLPFAPGRDDDGELTHTISLSQRFELLRAVMDLPEDDFYRLGDLAISSLLESSPFAPERHHILTGEPVLQYVRMGWSRATLPDAALSSSTVVQFAWAEHYYSRIQEGKDIIDNLNGLVSVLCMTPRRRMAIRICSIIPALGNILIRWDRKTATSVPMEVAFATLQYYYGSRMQLVRLFKPMFSRSGGGKSGPDYTSKYEWWGLIHDLAEKRVFGGFYATCYTNLHDLLHHVSYSSDKYREQEYKHRKHG